MIRNTSHDESKLRARVKSDREKDNARKYNELKNLNRQKRVYINDSYEHIFTPFFNSNTDGIRNNDQQLTQQRPMIERPEQVVTKPRSNKPLQVIQQQPTSSPSIQPSKIQPPVGSEYSRVIPPDKREKMDEKIKRDENLKSLKRLSTLKGRIKDEQLSKQTKDLLHNVPPDEYSGVSSSDREVSNYGASTQDSQAPVDVHVKAEEIRPKPSDDYELNAMMLNFRKNHPDVSYNDFKMMYDSIQKNPPKKDMTEKEIVEYAIQQFKKEDNPPNNEHSEDLVGGDLTVSDIHSEIQSKSGKFRNVIQDNGEFIKEYNPNSGRGILNPETGETISRVLQIGIHPDNDGNLVVNYYATKNRKFTYVVSNKIDARKIIETYTKARTTALTKLLNRLVKEKKPYKTRKRLQREDPPIQEVQEDISDSTEDYDESEDYHYNSRIEGGNIGDSEYAFEEGYVPDREHELQTIVIDNVEDGMKNLFISLASYDSGNVSNALINRIIVLSEYLYNNGEIDEEMYENILSYVN